MAKRKEPDVIVKRIDTSVSATINATRATTYIGLEAETGPYDLQEITSTKNLINKYSTKSKPGIDDGVTMVHAGKFTQSFVANCLRVNRDKIHVGIDSVGNTLFFDERYELIPELTNITLTPSRKNISNQSLLIVVAGDLFYNAQAAADESNMSKSIYEYKFNETSELYEWTDVAISTVASVTNYTRKKVIESWDVDKKHQIAATDTDNFLDLVSKELVSNGRFISYTNNRDRILMLSGHPAEEYENHWDYLTQWDPNFLAEQVEDNSGNLILVSNNGVTDDPYETYIPFENESDLSHVNKLFWKYGDQGVSEDNRLVYNGVTYYALGQRPASGISNTSVSTQLVNAHLDENLRDGVLSAINSIYQEDTKSPSSYVEQSVVIKSPEGKIFVKQDASGNKRTAISDNLSDKIKLEVISFDTLPSTVAPWININEYELPSTVTAHSSNYLKITFKGNVSKIESGNVDLVIASTANPLALEYILLSFKVGSTSTSNAISVDLVNDLATTESIVDAIIPNLIASYDGQDWTEILPVTSTNATDHDVDSRKCYYSSNVRSISMNLVNTNFSWTGFSLNEESVITKIQNQTNYKTTYQPQSKSIYKSENNGVNFFIIGPYVFYNALIPEVANSSNYTFVQLSKNTMTSEEFITALKAKLYDYFKVALTNEGSIIINGPVDKLESGYHNSDLECTWISSTQSSEAQFAVVQKFTSKASLSQFVIRTDEDDDEIIYLTNVHSSESHDDTISFNSNKVNGYGVNVYYDKFNALDRAFHITKLSNDGAVTSFTSPIFGNEIKPKKATEQDYIDALDTLRDIDFKPQFLFDAGLCSVQYYKSLTVFGEECHAAVPVSMPDGSVDEVLAFKSALGFATEQVCYDGWQRDVAFGDVPFVCCPGYYYLQLVLTNTNSVIREFQPIFHKLQGRIETSDPVRTRTRDERETLLDANINSIIRVQDEGYSYFNLNYTNQSYESDFSEEQNVRISNKIAHIADPYVDLNALAKNNGPTLWNNITNGLNGLIDDGIFKNRTDNTAIGFRVVCDETNNDANTRKVVVDIYVTYAKSVTEVLVYSRTQELAG